MRNFTEEKIHKKFKQLTRDDREALSNCLSRGLNLTDTAKYLNCDISTIKKEIDRNKELVIIEKGRNKCGLKKKCDIHNVCGNSNCTRKCHECIKPHINCNEYCPHFVREPKCKKLKHLCGVCNGCDSRQECTLNRWFYKCNEAQKIHEINITEARKGISISQEELNNFTSFLSTFVKRNISLDIIKQSYPDKFPYSIQTVYNWIDKGYIRGINNLDLPRKVRYRSRSKKKVLTKNDYSYLEGRYFDDFQTYMIDHYNEEVVEMDTVEGCNKSSYILTLLFRKSNFMLSFKLKDHTAESVIYIFDYIKLYIGEEIFKQMFHVILTDRGTEFTLPEKIEFNKKNERLSRVFYCDSRQSQQKGKIEKNHEELRKICPKGFDFNSISQSQLNLVLSHVNSYPRKSLNYKSPYELFKVYAHPIMLDLNDSKHISLNKIQLNPYLLKD